MSNVIEIEYAILLVDSEIEDLESRKQDLYWRLIRENNRCPHCNNSHYPHCASDFKIYGGERP
jgi:hypothetical protein